LNAADITVRLGEHSHRHDSGYERNYSVKSIRPHNKFDKSSFVHNIALIILKNPVQITNSIKPICLAAASLPLGGRLASVAGLHSKTSLDI
jgi:Trypsin